jgi:hypothetical protein
LIGAWVAALPLDPGDFDFLPEHVDASTTEGVT